ncbi:lipoprotein, putative [Metapseudomonas furukawaii]|uniref:Lipoprotein, putative n=2 Tax=Metapseudomonas furukawaii TaxID=1149133 RepID=A0AAD1BYZ0_METFU|nr:lipoprotein, putative [Pseudomonas furukawaii]
MFELISPGIPTPSPREAYVNLYRQAWPFLLGTLLMAGCASTRDTLLAQGYPMAFVDGFEAGCSSGRQAAGVITGEFRKDVPRYLKDATYAEGWSDGFRQCQAQVQSEERRHHEARLQDGGDDWERNRGTAMGRALHPD